MTDPWLRKEVFGNATLYLGDCCQIAPALGFVDAAVFDPPYGIGESGKKNNSRGTASAKWKRPKAKDYGDDDWDRHPCPPEMITWARTNSRWQIIFGGNHLHELITDPRTGKPMKVGLPPSSCWLVWDKETSGDFADAELAWTNLPKAVRLKRWLWNGMVKRAPETRYHLTQKPLEVMRWCIGMLPAEGGGMRIIDPFMGSGTTGVAAIQLGHRFIGIEREARHFETACMRISAAVPDGPVYLPPDSKKLDLFGAA